MKFRGRALIFGVVIVATLLFGYLTFREGQLAPEPKSVETKIFIIPPGESLPTIANNLEKEGLIRNRLVFFFVVKQLGIEKKIQAGDYRLSPSMNAYEVAKQLTHGTLDVWVTIPEGLRNEEIASILSTSLAIPEVELLSYMKGEEGYLFPDTYLIAKTASPDAAVKKLSDTFDVKVAPLLAGAKNKHGLTQNQIMTIASLVEREAVFPEDRSKVASVILRRFNEGMPLQLDSTLQYVLGYDSAGKTWWRKVVTNDDKAIDSAYNTYKNAGLPPAPICNPGLASIKSVLDADPNTPYLFFVADKNGHDHFARNAEEHQQNINRYCTTCE